MKIIIKNALDNGFWRFFNFIVSSKRNVILMRDYTMKSVWTAKKYIFVDLKEITKYSRKSQKNVFVQPHER